jgi:2-polyprenyl-3-methyl-5-hydroxy-6-metoxy-1,4-benzoquinol methylase
LGDGLHQQSAKRLQLVSSSPRNLALIERAGQRSASIIDLGGGESTLVDDLLARGYQNITVLDISQTAIDVTRARLKQAAERVHWVTADVTKADLVPSAYDVWHDRAVFHFLTSMEQRVAYVHAVAHSVKQGGMLSLGRSDQKVRQNVAALM